VDAGGAITSSVVVDRSLPFAAYYVASVARCKATRHTPSCQALANLCALTLFSSDHPTCQAYQDITKTVLQSSINGFKGWYLAMPWLFYEQTTQEVLFATGINRGCAFVVV